MFENEIFRYTSLYSGQDSLHALAFYMQVIVAMFQVKSLQRKYIAFCNFYNKFINILSTRYAWGLSYKF